MNESLQQKLNNGLRQRLDVNGSPEYSLTWKEWDIRGQGPICALRASGRRISDRDCSGWPTPNVRKGGLQSDPQAAMERRSQGHMMNLDDAATLAGWNTPRATDGSNGGPNQAGGALSADAALAGRTTPRATDPKAGHNYTENTAGKSLAADASLSGWATPTSRDYKDGNAQSCQNVPVNKLLGREVLLVGWGSPRSSETGRHRTESALAKAKPKGGSVAVEDQVHGVITNLSPAATENRGALNPEFVRWLMGFPPEWLSSEVLATLSSRKSRRNSFKHILNL